MRAYNRKPVPERLRHKIVETATGFELRTHYGYLLRSFVTRDEAREFYATHCPAV